MQNEQDVIIRYLEDAIAAERAFETQLRGFANEGDEPEARQMFARHAEETRAQHQLLSERLNSLGGTPSGMKSFLANMFGLAPKAAQIGYDESERVTQNLIMAFSVENSEVAMYEALALAAEAAGDAETEQLARAIQKQEQETAEKVWALLPVVGERSLQQGGRIQRRSSAGRLRVRRHERVGAGQSFVPQFRYTSNTGLIEMSAVSSVLGP